MPRLPGNIEKCGLLLCCVLLALFTCIISYISLSLKANVKLLSERIIRLETTGIWMSGIKLTFTSVLNAQCRWGKRCRGSSPVSQHRFMSCWSDSQICNSERHVPSVKFFSTAIFEEITQAYFRELCHILTKYGLQSSPERTYINGKGTNLTEHLVLSVQLTVFRLKYVPKK